jgi:hypothetical protein
MAGEILIDGKVATADQLTAVYASSGAAQLPAGVLVGSAAAQVNALADAAAGIPAQVTAAQTAASQAAAAAATPALAIQANAATPATPPASVADGAQYYAATLAGRLVLYKNTAGTGAKVSPEVSLLQGSTLDGPAYQYVGLPQGQNPVLGTEGAANTRVLTKPAAQDSTLAQLTFYAGHTGTLNVKVYPVTSSSSGAATAVGAAISQFSLVVASTGVQTPALSIAVPINHVVGIYDPVDILTYANTAGDLTATLTADNTAGGALTAGTVGQVWQIAAVLQYSQQVVTASAVQPLIDGKISAAISTTAGLATLSSTRAAVTDYPGGTTLADKPGTSWRDAEGKVLSVAVGQAQVAGMKRYFLARDSVGKSNLVDSWADQSGAQTLVQVGAAAPFDRRGIHNCQGRTPRLDTLGTSTMTAVLARTHDTPDGSAYPLPSGGFTNTGLTRLPSLEWLVGNHGTTKTDDQSSNPVHGTLVFVSPSFRKITLELDFFAGRKIANRDVANATALPGGAIANLGSIQGVAAIDNNTFWFTDGQTSGQSGGNNKLWKTDRTGAILDSIDVSAIAAGFPVPNGLAYDPVLNGLWIGFNSVTGTGSATAVGAGTSTAYLISLASGTKGTVLRTMSIRTDADQFFWDSVNRYLAVSAGSNGSDGQIEIRDMYNSRVVARYNLPGSQAIEGFSIEGNKLWCVNDGGFHISAVPSLSVLQEYDITAPPASIYSDVLTLGVVLRQVAAAPSAQIILTEGDPVSTSGSVDGWALGLISTGLRLFVKMRLDAALLQVDFAIADLQKTAFTKAVIRIDRLAGTATMLLNGATITGTISAGSLTTTSITSPFNVARLSAYGLNATTQRNLTSAEVAALFVGGDCVAADVLARIDADTKGLA